MFYGRVYLSATSSKEIRGFSHVVFVQSTEGVAARLLSKLYRHFHTPCQCLLNVEGLACSVCLHSEVADVLMQDYGG